MKLRGAHLRLDKKMKPTPLDHEKRGEDVPIGVVCSKNCGERLKIFVFLQIYNWIRDGGFVSFCPDELIFTNTKSAKKRKFSNCREPLSAIFAAYYTYGHVFSAFFVVQRRRLLFFV